MMPAAFLAFATGFLSLSMEILWIRLFSFANHSMPQAFSFVLAVYLIGIAFGAQLGKWCCRQSYDLWCVCGVALVLSSAIDLTGPWIYAALAVSHSQLVVAGCVIMLTAMLKAIAFPIAHHLGTPAFAVDIGRKISRVYVSNIAGATLGPIFTGLALLAWVTTQQGFLICAALTFCMALYCLARVLTPIMQAASVLAMALPFFLVMQTNQHALIKRIAAPSYGDIIQILENQYGIITLYAGGRGGDVVAGGNAYDGRTNLDPVINSNRINRLLILAALVDKPTNVLMIGLSIGSWLKLVTAFPGVENIDVIEINPGYVDLMQHYPRQASALLDPRVHLYIDDGRRWLKNHPNRQYDMVVINTTYHWRAYVTNLLSQEFLHLLKRHMREGAVLEYNTTGSPDALKTATTVFKHAYLYENFVIAADFDWREKRLTPDAIRKLQSLTLDGSSLYPPGSERLIAGYLQMRVTPVEVVEPVYLGMGRELEVITDRNMITEFKYGKSL